MDLNIHLNTNREDKENEKIYLSNSTEALNTIRTGEKYVVQQK